MHMTDMEMTECDTQVNKNLLLVLPVLLLPYLFSFFLSLFFLLLLSPSSQSFLILPLNTVYSFSSLFAFHSPDPDVSISQVLPAQTFHQISQDSPSHSAVQTRCSEIFLVGRIPSLVSLVSHKQVRICLFNSL